MRVLLVEDDATTSASIEMMLRKESFICDTTDLGEDGLEIGKLYDYDIIILDLLLPDMDGYEVLRRLRAARVRTPILILSGLAELDHKIKGLGFGADDFLTKPFEQRELVARIQAIVRPRHEHVANRQLVGRGENWAALCIGRAVDPVDDERPLLACAVRAVVHGEERIAERRARLMAQRSLVHGEH